MLRTLHHFWSRAADMKPALSVVNGPGHERAAGVGLPGLAATRAA
jgi:hypothetical protein